MEKSMADDFERAIRSTVNTVVFYRRDRRATQLVYVSDFNPATADEARKFAGRSGAVVILVDDTVYSPQGERLSGLSFYLSSVG